MENTWKTFHAWHTLAMRLVLTKRFEHWVAQVEKAADKGDANAVARLQLISDQLDLLQGLTGEPEYDTARLKVVRQSGKHEVWRVSHPFYEGVAVRTICWFTGAGEVVVILFGNDKAKMGDVFYNTVGSRADQIVDEWIASEEGKS